ncbi:hypothetical protein [Candidatus Nitrotoga sp. M5]|uniref:hypothetical protein n=1 Tax=Candidatus Nitrotoga sp. M5 TaxID=2890409 RepID=UPI001EF60FF1|nr:hypothetical protein [Candidatus Nitrotoga sp. M5]
MLILLDSRLLRGDETEVFRGAPNSLADLEKSKSDSDVKNGGIFSENKPYPKYCQINFRGNFFHLIQVRFFRHKLPLPRRSSTSAAVCRGVFRGLLFENGSK